MKRYGWLIFGCAFLTGCVSPSVTVHKNVTVFTKGDVTVTYTTKADLKTTLDLIQDIKPKTDLKLK